MGRMYSDDIQSKLNDINNYISEEYRLTHPKGLEDIRAAILKEGQYSNENA